MELLPKRDIIPGIGPVYSAGIMAGWRYQSF